MAVQHAQVRQDNVFPILRDGTGMLQCVAVKSALPEASVRNPSRTSPRNPPSLSRGNIRAEQRAPGGYEMDVEELEVGPEGAGIDPYPSRRRITASIS